jgi:hypothetical protein
MVRDAERLYNWVLADAEAAKYKDEKPQARKYLQDLRALKTLYEVAFTIQKDGFHWKKENFDFTSYPWVTIARRRGDCDDFRELWRSALKGKGRTRRVFVNSTEGRAHAMLLFEGGDKLYLLSNTRVRGVGEPGGGEKLARLFYGDKTQCVVIY